MSNVPSGGLSRTRQPDPVLPHGTRVLGGNEQRLSRRASLHFESRHRRGAQYSVEKAREELSRIGRCYFMSRQFGPIFVSATSGTRSLCTPSITSFTSFVRREISSSGASNSNSSWT